MGFFDKVKNALESCKNFNYLDDLIHSGAKEIVLDSDIVLGDGEKSQYLEGIKLDVDDLNIDGNGYEIDAQGFTRIFQCTGKGIVIKNIILKNGFTDEDGGAIQNCGELTITDSTLTENTATGCGGAIYNRTGELTITESVFNNNMADCGGAIHNSWGEIAIHESTITENTAHYGGSISNWGGIDKDGGKLTITESMLSDNMASWGGAIHNEEGELRITESVLSDNTSQFGGGAIHNYMGELTITESVLNNNAAEECGGGAIWNRDYGSLTIIESKLNNNTAKGDGGIICNLKGNFKIFDCEFSSNKSPDTIILNNDSFQIDNTTFNENQSKDIVLNDGDGANLSIFNGEFNENHVGKSVICNSGTFCSVEKTIFEKNNFSNNTLNIINESKLTLISPKIKDKGKSILNQKCILIRKSPHELKNIIYGEGTVKIDEKIIPQGENFDFGYLDKKIHESNTKEIIIDHDITFEDYERDFYEGGIELDIDNLIIDGNGKTITGAGNSRMFIVTGNKITLKNIIFKNGHSHNNYDNLINNNGGAIKINQVNNITIKSCEFINNVSDELGGAIVSTGELTVIESALNDNTAKFMGGAIHNSKVGELKIIDSELNDNTANNGGAIDNRGELTVIESELNDNTAQKGDGGAIDNRGELTVIESELNDNTAQEGDGGAIHNYKSELTITGSALNNNKAQYGGGAISHDGGVHHDGSELTITESTLNNNTANNGGAIHNDGGELTIIESELNDNTAQKGDGGAIYNYEEKSFNITNCKLENNQPNDY